MAQEALHSPETLRGLILALRDERAVVTTRAANALKKVSEAKPGILGPYALPILRVAGECTELQARWNLLQVLGGLPLRGKQKALAVDLFFEALRSESGFLRAFALTGLANYAGEDAELRKRVQPILKRALEDTSAAVRARARKLVKRPSAPLAKP